MFWKLKCFLYWICSVGVMDVSHADNEYYDPLDPMSIVRATDPDNRTEYVERFYGAAELFQILKRGFIIICICAVLVSLISLLFVNKAEMVADKKANVIHKLEIVFLISSFGTILSIILHFVHAVF